MSFTNGLLRCITILQYGWTREILQAGIETRLTFRLSDVLPQNHRHSQRK